MTALDTRWKLRFQNYQSAYSLLNEALEQDPNSLSRLEEEGIIQRFEYTFDLACKALNAKMEADGLTLNRISPKAVARQAYAGKYIDDIEGWLRMIGDRSVIHHTYKPSEFEAIIETLRTEYRHLLDKLHHALQTDYLADAGVTPEHIAEAVNIIARYPAVEEVVLHGSRATGAYTDRSDLDLALLGRSLDHQTLSRIKLDLDESDVPVTVDIVDYSGLEDGELKAHIDRVGKVVFSRPAVSHAAS